MRRHNKLFWGLCLLVIASLIPSDNCTAGADTKSDNRWDYTQLADKSRFADFGSGLNSKDFSSKYELLIKYFQDTSKVINMTKNNIINNNDKYGERTLDYLLNTILNRSITENQTINNIPISRSHKQFWAIIERVKLLPTTKEGYNSQVATEIKESIFSLKNYDDFLYSYLYLAQHFLRVPEIYQSRYFYIENANGSLSRVENDSLKLNNAKELIGDFCAKWDLLPKALKYYLEVYNFNIQKNNLERAEIIRMKIADMLYIYGNNDKQFLEKSLVYYLPKYGQTIGSGPITGNPSLRNFYFERIIHYLNIKTINPEDGPDAIGRDTSVWQDSALRVIFLKQNLNYQYLKSSNFEIIDNLFYYIERNIYYGLETAEQGLVIASKQSISSDESFRIFILIANCFSYLPERNHQQTALFYYKYALLSSINHNENYNVSVR